MKHSVYNYFLESGKSHFIYNGLSGACIMLSSKEYMDFLRNKIPNESLSKFAQLGFVIEDSFDETSHYLSMVQKENELSTRRFYRILTTTSCNANCFYCYEKGVLIQTMDDHTANDVADFIIRKQKSKRDLLIQFFGGEPLCNTRAIDIISEKLTKSGLLFQASMTTNGFLINDSIVRKAKDIWNIRKTQITLDGTKNLYESIKGFNFPNAFERVIENIHLLSSAGIKVSIRLNYSEKTKEDILTLITFLSSEYKNDKNINVYAYRLFDDVKNSHTDEKIRAFMEENGFLSKKEKNFPDLILNPCMARRKDSLVILPNGDLAKCSRGLKLKNGIIGNIYQNEELPNTWELLNPDCIKCKHLPLCGGGCKCEELMKENFCALDEKQINKRILHLIKSKENLL